MTILQNLQKIKLTQATTYIFRKTVLVGLITLLAKLLFVARDLIVAWKFGRSQFLEAFILAFLIPFTFSQTLSNSLTIAFIPKLINLRKNHSFEEATRVYQSLFVILLIFALVGTIFCLVAFPLYSLLIMGSFSEQTIYFLQVLLYLTAPAAFIGAITNLWKELLNAEQKFLQSSAVSIITPLCSIILLIFSQNTGVFALSLGLLLGGFVELILLGFFLKNEPEFRLIPKFKRGSLELRPTIKSWWKLFISNAMSNSAGLVDSIMAARRSELGGLAALSYGKKVVTFPMDIAATAFSTVLIPHLSELAAKRDWYEFRKTINRWLLIILFATLPIILFINLFAKFIIRLLFERGAFSSNDTDVVSVMLIYYTFQLPFFVMYYLMLRVLPIINKTTSSIVFGAMTLILTILLNYLFIKLLGTAGIVLSTSCTYFILALSLYFFINFQSKKLFEK